MKKIIISLYSILLTIWIAFKFKSIQNTSNTFWLTKFSGIKRNTIKLSQSVIKKTSISITGKDNNIYINNCSLSNVNINIFGNNNHIEISPNAKINSTKFVLRGNNCRIRIGAGTSFGSAYIVCMGKNNHIDIGEECMFADDIEIWNTDSHPIYDKQGNIVNPSRPINIGNHVWCGKGGKILKGVNIGNNAIIGMQSVVTKDIPAQTLNVGIPSKTVREGINWDRNFITI